MNIRLNPLEARVLGSLMEKSVVTPDQYPLTLNALVNACNQKSSRDPVLNLTPAAVLSTVRELETKHLVSSKENFRSNVEKYRQRLCNTTFGQLKFSDAEFAVVCLLLLRGAQTPGELKSRSGRLHVFADSHEVGATLKRLMERDDGPFVARLPRAPGRQDSAYVHLFGGPVEVPADAPPADARPAPHPAFAAGAERMDRLTELETRIAALERELAELRRRLPPVE
jgi:uncharacterized protein